MPFRFDDRIAFDGDAVIAVGPLAADESVKEVCAWVYQSSADRAQDAAATEMTTNRAPGEGESLFRQMQGRWLLQLTKLEDTDTAFDHNRPAFAVAVALMTDNNGMSRVVWWGHPVTLVNDSAYVGDAATFLASTAAVLAATPTRPLLTPFPGQLADPVAAPPGA